MSAITRRTLVVAGAALALDPSRAFATPETMASAMTAFTGGAPVRDGGVTLDLAPLIENGNSAPLSVSVDSPMTAADHVVEIRVFNEKNPLPEVATFRLGPRCGRAVVSTRIKLADSQTIHAIALLSDGTFRGASATVIVTIAACIEVPT